MPLLKTAVSGSANASAGMGYSANRSAAAAGGAKAGPGGWHPTILYMLALIVAEVLIVAFLSRNLLKG
ncbi:MAG: hypothetical protein ACRDND_25700 [Streptosporangiaceae bacterium]